MKTPLDLELQNYIPLNIKKTQKQKDKQLTQLTHIISTTRAHINPWTWL